MMLKKLEKTIPESPERLEMYQKMDVIIDYFNSYIRIHIEDLGFFQKHMLIEC